MRELNLLASPSVNFLLLLVHLRAMCSFMIKIQRNFIVFTGKRAKISKIILSRVLMYIL